MNYYTELLNQLKDDEGVRYVPYKCTEGYWTVGVGRNLETNPLNSEEQIAIFGKQVTELEAQIDEIIAFPLTDDQVETLLLSDVGSAEESCHSNISFFNNLSDPRKAGFINMAFQLGITGLLNFKNSLAAAEVEDWPWCKEELEDSKWYREQTPERAERVIEQIYSGEYI
jgi:lysozyme